MLRVVLYTLQALPGASSVTVMSFQGYPHPSVSSPMSLDVTPAEGATFVGGTLSYTGGFSNRGAAFKASTGPKPSLIYGECIVGL